MKVGRTPRVQCICMACDTSYHKTIDEVSKYVNGIPVCNECGGNMKVEPIKKVTEVERYKRTPDPIVYVKKGKRVVRRGIGASI